jgi:hypothetical protein
VNDLAEMIRDYIHECFDNHDYIPDDSEIYTKFQSYEPSEHIIEKEINFFFDGYYILPTTKVKWEGVIYDGIQIQREIGIGEDEERFKVS